MAVYRPTYKDPKTGERKEAQIWWYEFTFAGRRIRESSKSTRKTIAVEAAKRRRLEPERAMAGIPAESAESRIRTVSEVLKDYAAGYCVNHRRQSNNIVVYRSRHVERLLGSVLLPDLREQEILAYIGTRQREGASNRTINLELLVLSRSMGQTWRTLWPKVRKLEENRDAGRALEPDEEKAILDAAAGSRSRLIYPFLMVLDWTGIRSDEARTLQWLQVDFEAGEIIIGKSKSEGGRGRSIPMSGALRAALEHYASWYASKLGPIQPDWYVFPKSNRIRPTDPTAPVTSLKRAWESVRDKAGVKCRLHDLRHSLCTKLGEADTPEQVMLDIMGHIGTAMLRRYSHIRARARREAIAAVEARANSIGIPKESPKVSGSLVKATPVTN